MKIFSAPLISYFIHFSRVLGKTVKKGLLMKCVGGRVGLSKKRYGSSYPKGEQDSRKEERPMSNPGASVYIFAVRGRNNPLYDRI